MRPLTNPIVVDDVDWKFEICVVYPLTNPNIVVDVDYNFEFFAVCPVIINVEFDEKLFKFAFVSLVFK